MKARIIVFLCLLLAGSGSSYASEPWKLSDLDFYYSGNLHQYKLRGRDLLAIDREANPNTLRLRFDPNFISADLLKYTSAFHSDLVFTKWLNRKFISSYDLRFGLAYSGAGRTEYYPNEIEGAVFYQNADTSFQDKLSYGFRERSFSIHLAYLFNIRLNNDIAFYTGADLLYTPFYEIRGQAYYMHYEFKTSDPEAYRWGFGFYEKFKLLRNTTFSLAATAGVKFNLDCWWNIFFEYQYGSRINSVKAFPQFAQMQSFRGGFRYKFGRHESDNIDADRKLFW